MGLPLSKPIIGSTGWGDAVNQNFIDIEELLSGLQPVPGMALEDDLEMGGYEILNAEDLELTGAWTNLATALDTRYYTQDEVNEIIAGAIFGFWLSDTADGVIGGYNRMFDADTGEIKSSIGPTTLDADPKLIQAFITAIGQPDFTVLSEGVFSFDIHAVTTVGANVKAARIRWLLYKRTQPGGVETLLITSEDGPILTDVETHYQVHGTLPAEVNLDTTDRLVLKVYGVREGAEPQNPAVTIYMEGDTQTRIELRTNLTAFDNRYLLRNGLNEMLADLDVGGNDIVDVGLVDTVNVAALKTDVDEFPDQLKQLLTVEIQQLENIGATTISAGQWAWLGSLINLLNLTEAEAQQLEKINDAEISSGQWAWLGSLTNLLSLTEAEAAQLLNIGANEISEADWAVVAAGGGAGGAFVGRGDAASWDFTKTAFTTDGAIHDLDLSAIVPEGAKAVLFYCQANDGLTGQVFYFAKNGENTGYNTTQERTAISGVPVHLHAVVECDANRIIDYFFSNTTWSSIYFVVRGWWT